jgi:hypothetical protein
MNLRLIVLLVVLVAGCIAQRTVGPGQITQVSGSGNTLVTTTGTQTSGDCVKIDASGNHVASGLACAAGVTTNQNIRTIGVNFEGGGSALSGTLTRCTHVAYSGTIQGVTLIADQSGNATIDVKTVAYASYTGPASTASIAASAIPALSSAVKFNDTTLTGWTTSLAANTEVCFALSSPATVTWLQATLKIAVN